MLPLKKIFFGVISFIFAAAFSGCSFAGSVDLLLSPPKLSAEQTAVYEALVRSAGKDVKLQYPRYGEYRSAFVFADIDGDEGDEALVFYEKTGESEGAGNVRINVIDMIDGEWRSVYDHAGVGTVIDRIIFADIGSSEKTSVIIGYTLLSGEKNAVVYSYEDGRLFSDYSDNYSTMFVLDMDRDGLDNLVLIRPGNQLKKASMSLVSRSGEDGSVAETGSIALDESAVDFVNVISGYVGTGTPAIFIDGLTGGQLTTEIIYSMNGSLRNPLYLGESGMIENTRRQAGYLSTDIDLDGIVEIPTRSPLPGYVSGSRESLYSTDWNVFDNYSIVKKYSSYYSIADGYCFIFPSRWDGVVTAKKDDAAGDIVFYRFQTDITNSSTELMRIAVAGDYETDAYIENGYTLLKSNNHTNYFVKLPDIEYDPLVLTSTEINNNFYIIV
ncbi:MAG: hypothetical protein K2K44_12500 [Oscillospiraceae bacterium]|nr:hypothetical protein [Oscillospiraceae bacterium]